MSALEGKGFNLTPIQTAFEDVEMNSIVDSMRKTQQRNGVAIPFDQGPARGATPDWVDDEGEASVAAVVESPNSSCRNQP